MSASPVFSSAAIGRPFIFPARSSAALLAQLDALPKFATAITPAARLHVRPAPEMVSCGIRELDALTGGLPRGCLTEICGPASSGKTGILLAALSQATRRGEVCALVDASDALNLASADAAGIEMGRLLWIRCKKQNSPPRRGVSKKNEGISSVPQHLSSQGRGMAEAQLEQVLKVTDLLLQSNGFGMIVLDLADIPVRSARRIPLASWFRFRRAIEQTPTVVLIVEQQPIAGSCSSMLIQVSGVRSQVSGNKFAAPASRLALRLAHTELLDEFEITAELLHSRLERKPMQSVKTNFRTHAQWA
jgi:hypothetical protein